MIYLSGVVRHELVGVRIDLGFLVTPRSRHLFDLEAGPWALDNACFSAGDEFDADVYVRFLRRRRAAARTCLFAPAPDVVGDAEATLMRSRPVLARIRAEGFRAAYVAQDGATGLPWDEFDVLFIGGTTEFKLSHQARDLVAEAKQHGKAAHMGRVNSETRLRTAAMWGCDSADGTFLKYAPTENVERMTRWLDRLNRQPQLVFA